MDTDRKISLPSPWFALLALLIGLMVVVAGRHMMGFCGCKDRDDHEAHASAEPDQTDFEQILVALDDIGPTIPYGEREERLLAIKADIVALIWSKQQELNSQAVELEQEASAIASKSPDYGDQKHKYAIREMVSPAKYKYYAECSCGKFHDSISKSKFDSLVAKEQSESNQRYASASKYETKKTYPKKKYETYANRNRGHGH